MIRRTLAATALIAAAASASASPDAAPPAATPAPAEQAPAAVATPVFAEQTCHVSRPRDVVRARLAVDVDVKDLAWGTAFAYRTGGRVLLVTAAHVVEIPADIASVTERNDPTKDSDDKVYAAAEGFKIERGSARLRVGGIAVRPKRMLVDASQDIALLELSEQDLAALHLETLAAAPVARDAEVKIWGFPAVQRGGRSVPSASQTSQRTDVTDVRPGEVICAPLNGKETRGGFSGGPLVDNNGKVVGMIMRSTTENTRCRSMAAIDELAKGFDQRAVPYVERPARKQ